MEIADYVRVLKRSWLLIVIAMIAGGLGGYWVYGSQTPLYRSAVQMIVPGSGRGVGNEVNARLLATQRALALSQVANTVPALDAAKKAAGFPSADVTASSTSNGNGPFLSVSVVGQSPTEVKAIADEFPRTLATTMVKLEGRGDAGIRVTALAPASLPGKPFSPHLQRAVGIGVGAGLVLGILIAVLREAFDRTVRDSADVDQLTDLTILGTVPRDMSKSLLPAVSNPRSARAEGYRQVRTTLINRRDSDLNLIAVTSASLGEGKTSVATNLAAVFSRAGHRVVVVDADLRRPSVATFFGLKAAHGLSDVLADTCSLSEALNILDDGRLAVLTSGAVPANPSEALGGAAMERTLEQLTAEYDYVLIDTPPVLPVSDPLVVAPLVDGVILVIQLGRTTRDQVERAKKALERVNAPIIGVVPNMSGKGHDRYYLHPYRYAYSRRRNVGGPSADLPVSINGGRRRSHVTAEAYTGNDQPRAAGTGADHDARNLDSGEPFGERAESPAQEPWPGDEPHRG